jgi:hypothetical protein
MNEEGDMKKERKESFKIVKVGFQMRASKF